MVSVEAVLLLVEDEVSVLIVLLEDEALGDVLDVSFVVPLAPIVDVLLEELGLVELLDVVEEFAGAVLDEPPTLLLSSFDVDRLLPPLPDVAALPLLLPVCATAMPPMASAAAAANVVSVFLVVLMSFAP